MVSVVFYFSGMALLLGIGLSQIAHLSDFATTEAKFLHIERRLRQCAQVAAYRKNVNALCAELSLLFPKKTEQILANAAAVEVNLGELSENRGTCGALNQYFEVYLQNPRSGLRSNYYYRLRP